jgi:hypothetical protein
MAILVINLKWYKKLLGPSKIIANKVDFLNLLLLKSIKGIYLLVMLEKLSMILFLMAEFQFQIVLIYLPIEFG